MAFGSLFLVFLAHFFFQIYLFMPPCEQCVYIRFAFFCMAIGGLVASIEPRKISLRAVGYIFGFGGSLQGIIYSYKLNLIHKAIRDNNPFGLEGCSLAPTFPFSLPLDRWFPSLFLPAGDCGYDNPILPDEVKLSKIQQYFVNLYSDGWYLFPSSHTINMAQCTFVVFLLSAIVLIFMSIFFIKELKSKF